MPVTIVLIIVDVSLLLHYEKVVGIVDDEEDDDDDRHTKRHSVSANDQSA